jgi:hypothetical protein
VRVRVPYDSEGKRLRFHGVPEEVNGTGLIITAVRSDDASYITGVELAVWPQPPPETSLPRRRAVGSGMRGLYKGEGPSTQALGAGFPRLSATRGLFINLHCWHIADVPHALTNVRYRG